MIGSGERLGQRAATITWGCYLGIKWRQRDDAYVVLQAVHAEHWLLMPSTDLDS